jgi:hypothetical protein
MMDHHGASESTALSRRRLLAASGAAILTSVTGCSAIVDAIGDQVLEEVNILNQLNRAVSGSIEVTSPAGDTVLDETFEVPSEEADDESNIVAYDDVWTETGRYRVRIDLPDTEIDGVSRATETVRIENTDEEMIAVALGTTSDDEPIAVRVGESLSDFGRTTESG